MPTNNPILNRAGPVVQHIYLVSFLQLLCRYECLRMHTIAFAMFPLRTQSAALSAAQRIVTNAKKKKYIVALNWMDGRRYYALTATGARFLNELDPENCARSTVSALNLQNKNHRDWGVLIAIASEQRQMRGFSESQIAGSMHQDISTYFGHVPDAVTLYDEEGRHFAAWHEVELSRRSTSGTKKLTHLLQTLILRRYLTHNDHEHDINLVMHCATTKIERENHRVIQEALAACGAEVQELEDDADAAYVARVGAGRAHRWFSVYINLLPESIELSGASSLPWPGCPGVVSSDIDVFLQPVATTA